jgi:hypothetical protein
LNADFDLEWEDQRPWAALLHDPTYRRDLRGNHYGHLAFSNRNHNRLRKMIRDESDNDGLSPRQLLALLPAATRKALKKRLIKLRMSAGLSQQ